MNNKVYFGTKDRMRWVKAPAVNTPLTKGGWANTGTDLNGGGYAKLSPSVHREYEFSWGASPAQDIYDVLDYRSGAYGLGPLYYLDPFAMRTNAFSESFSMPSSLCAIGRMGGTFSQPTGSRVEATNLATNPRAVTTSGTVEVWRNYCTRPVPRAGWGAPPAGGTTPDFKDDSRFAGGKSRGYDFVASAPAAPYMTAIAIAPTEVGQVWTFSFQYAISYETAVDIRCDGMTEVIGSKVTFDLGDGTFRQYRSYTSLDNTNARNPYLYCTSKTVDIGDTFYVGSAMFYVGSHIQPYFDGDTVIDSDLTPSWTGQVNNSLSILTGNVPTLAASFGRTVQSGMWAKDGNYSARVINVSSTTGEAFAKVPIAGAMSGLVAGSTYTFAGWVHLEAPQQGATHWAARAMCPVFNDAAGPASPKAPNEAGVHLIRYTFTVPVGTTTVVLRLYNGAMPGNGDVWWDSLTIAEGSHPNLMPFSGATRDLNGMNGRWTGTPDASTSELYTDINSPAYTETQQPLPVSVVGASSVVHYIPLPENHVMWVAYGATANVLQGNGTALTATSPTDTAMYWNRISESTEFQWAGTATVWGAVCLVLPQGQSPEPNQEWVPGRGSSGLKFAGEPQVTGMSAVYGDNGGLLNASARLIETELWSNE